MIIPKAKAVQSKPEKKVKQSSQKSKEEPVAIDEAIKNNEDTVINKFSSGSSNPPHSSSSGSIETCPKKKIK
jgi:hypothetical protein